MDDFAEITSAFDKFSRSYPFNHLNFKELKEYAESIERVYHVKELVEEIPFTSPKFNLLANAKSNSENVDMIIMSLRFILDNYKISYRDKLFVDLMGQGGEICLYASSFDFAEILDIEICEDGYHRCKIIMNKIPNLNRKMKVVCGSLLDYFPVDAFIFFMNCKLLEEGMLDEGIMIYQAFKMLKDTLAGSFIILVTSLNQINPQDFGIDYLKFILSSKLPSHGSMWIFSKL